MASNAVLRPYDPQRKLWVGWRVLLFVALVAVSAFYGMMAAVLPMRLISFPLAPILIMAGLILWLLPDIGGMHDRFYEKLLLWVLAVHMLWPPYIALNVPGLPWISPPRIVMAILVATFLMNLATSQQMRSEAAASVKVLPRINTVFWCFWLLTTLTVFISRDPSQAITKYVNNQIFWTMMFVLGAVVGRREGMARRAAVAIVASTIPAALTSMYEFRVGKVFWVEYLPTWLWGDTELVGNLLDSSARSTTADLYRVRGTTMNALYFAEYLSMVLPLAVHLAFTSKIFWKRALLAAGIMAMMVAMYLTGARSGNIGILLTFGLYTMLAAIRRRTDNPGSIGAMATLVSYPVIAMVGVATILLWRRAYVLVLGGGQHSPSNEAREVQWANGIDILQRNPIGHGAGNSAETLGYTNLGGSLTIDTYYLSLMLDYGVIALPLFFLIFSSPLFLAFKSVFRKNDNDVEMLVPMGIGLFNLLIIKSVQSSESNLPVAYILLGVCFALTARMYGNAREKVAADAKLPAAWRPVQAPQPAE
ncbi:hypothetical protein GCM10007973_29030 [Polymorphobacter multimanifer]|nr:hypothetical protein GCM10007973_29030 [Polymorphobacter multimanifer]